MQIKITSDEAIRIGHLIETQVKDCRVAKRALNITMLMSRKRLFGLLTPLSRSEAVSAVDDYDGYDHRFDSHKELGWSEMDTSKRLINAGKISTNGFVVVDDDRAINIIKCHTKKED